MIYHEYEDYNECSNSKKFKTKRLSTNKEVLRFIDVSNATISISERM